MPSRQKQALKLPRLAKSLYIFSAPRIALFLLNHELHELFFIQVSHVIVIYQEFENLRINLLQVKTFFQFSLNPDSLPPEKIL